MKVIITHENIKVEYEDDRPQHSTAMAYNSHNEESITMILQSLGEIVKILKEEVKPD
jgi:hypothetical protein